MQGATVTLSFARRCTKCELPGLRILAAQEHYGEPENNSFFAIFSHASSEIDFLDSFKTKYPTHTLHNRGSLLLGKLGKGPPSNKLLKGSLVATHLCVLLTVVAKEHPSDSTHSPPSTPF